MFYENSRQTNNAFILIISVDAYLLNYANTIDYFYNMCMTVLQIFNYKLQEVFPSPIFLITTTAYFCDVGTLKAVKGSWY